MIYRYHNIDACQSMVLFYIFITDLLTFVKSPIFSATMCFWSNRLKCWIALVCNFGQIDSGDVSVKSSVIDFVVVLCAYQFQINDWFSNVFVILKLIQFFNFRFTDILLYKLRSRYCSCWKHVWNLLLFLLLMLLNLRLPFMNVTNGPSSTIRSATWMLHFFPFVDWNGCNVVGCSNLSRWLYRSRQFVTVSQCNGNHSFFEN